MAVTTLSPGVYIDEIQKLPASVAPVATAVPAFIGYVEKAEKNGVGIPFNTPVRISSFLEYEAIFGTAQGQSFDITTNLITTETPNVREVTVSKVDPESLFRMYYNVQMYFLNGGGPCWVVPVGLYTGPNGVDKDELIAGITGSSAADEPTLLVYPDALSISPTSEILAVNTAALEQCALLQDRFTIMDAPEASTDVIDDIDNFRDLVSVDNLKYGAAYYPYLDTTLNFKVNTNLVHVVSQEVDGTPVTDSGLVITLLNSIEQAIHDTLTGRYNAKIQVATLDIAFLTNYRDTIETSVQAADVAATAAPAAYSTIATALTPIAASTTTGGAFYTAVDDYIATPEQTEAIALINAFNTVLSDLNTVKTEAYDITDGLSQFLLGSLNYLSISNPPVYTTALADINTYFLTINPSGAMAGIYARVDRERGVWKAPANVGIQGVSAPSNIITTSEQDYMNVDPTSGKSVNAIRLFTGRGTIVWGARTLAGNDNEWRYINVRRLFLFVEESVEKATQFVVFESNTANTWQRVRTMIESFLTGLWRDGALAGATTEEAFFVRVGLGTTMTAQDILEGKMIVEVGLAASRPAEFIVLQFSHKLQE